MNERDDPRRMLKVARDDLNALRVFQRLPAGEGTLVAESIFGFHAQQAVEKSLKAWLAFRGIRYPFVHDLALLAELLSDAGEDVAFTREATLLSPFAVKFRYDGPSEPSLHRAAVLTEVETIFAHVATLLADRTGPRADATMNYRTLGRTGLRVSEIGFGAWALGGAMWPDQRDEDSIAALHRAIDLGVNFIDTAAGYGNGRSEQVIARALKDRRERVIVATKIPPVAGAWPPTPYDRADVRYPESYLRERLEERLRFLNTDCIDVLQLHVWTRAWNRDPTPLLALEKFKREGKLRFYGISTNDYDQDDCTTLIANGLIDTVQLIYNIFEQSPIAEALPTALASGVGVIVRVALDEGSLAGKWKADHAFVEGDFRNRLFGGDRLARTVARVEKIKADLAGTGLTMPQAALKFALEPKAVSVVIPGMRNVAQVEANVGASALPPLSNELLTKLRAHAWARGNWYAGK